MLGNRLSRFAGHYYRRVFVDLRKVAQSLSSAIPPEARILDIGGGDGVPLNYLLALRPDVSVTSIDPAPVVGHWIEERYADRITRLPQTSLRQYVGAKRLLSDVLLISDVIHHVAVSERERFFADILELLEGNPSMIILIKDVEPGHLKSVLGYWSDRYVTGDKAVSLVSRDQLTRMVNNSLGPMRYRETPLFEIDKPNYAITFFR